VAFLLYTLAPCHVSPRRYPVQLKLAVSERLDQSVADCFGAWQLQLHLHARRSPPVSPIYWRVPLDAREYHSNDHSLQPSAAGLCTY